MKPVKNFISKYPELSFKKLYVKYSDIYKLHKS